MTTQIRFLRAGDRITWQASRTVRRAGTIISIHDGRIEAVADNLKQPRRTIIGKALLSVQAE